MPQTISYASIDASNRKRPIDPDHATWIAASIEEKGGGVVGEGLEQPIKVTPRDGGYRLVHGGHRHAGIGLLGWTDLVVGKHVVVEEMDDLAAELSEIDENLVRRELNALDRALFLAERRAIYEQINNARGHGGNRKADKLEEASKSQSLRLGFSPRFTVDVADKVGLSERAVQLSLQIAEKLEPTTIEALRGTKIERNQQALLALCDMPAEKQRKAAKLIGAGEAKTVAEARVAIGLDRPAVNDPQARLLATLLESWERADKTTRAGFLKEIGAALQKKGAA
ncbi:MAG: ParB/RepB/Spo0J family partition protein [Rhodoblastus sp.]